MRLNPVNCLIAVMVSALLTYGVASFDGNTLRGVIGIGSLLFFIGTLVVALGMNFNDARKGVNVKLVAGMFFVVGLIVNVFFAYSASSQAAYIITCGILFSLYVLIANGIYSAKH